MCGIVAVFGSTLPDGELRKLLLKAAKRIRHRGPDWSGVMVLGGGNAIVHERLAIIDPDSGAQPLLNEDKTIILAVNGEVYNYKELEHTLKVPYKFKTKSDCEVILPLYMEDSENFVNKLRGMFSFVLFDKNKNQYIAVRDHMGITPLYIGYGYDGSVWIASEMKAFGGHCARVKTFPPGHMLNSSTGALTPWYKPSWMEPGHIGKNKLDLTQVREAIEKAVVRRMMSDVPWGVLLSGGLDSSLVAAIATRHAKMKREDDGNSETWWPRVHSFSIGLEGSPDLKAAKEVADYLGTAHHTYTFTVQDGIDAISEVIYHLETYDLTTVRASTPMYLLSRKIKAYGIKMVLSGEGADEIFGGYLYFHKAPNKDEFHKETVDKLKALHLYDCLRANKSTSAWGIEARVPFLDLDFLELAMNLDPEEKMIDKSKGRMEKWIMRAAFDTPEKPYLPSHILWRQKEQFSDGVGYSWIDGLKEYAEREISNAQMASASHRFPHNPPTTKEGYLYRSIFESHFPSESAVTTVPGGPSIACSTPRAIEWDESFKNMADPSGRAVSGVHVAAYTGNGHK